MPESDVGYVAVGAPIRAKPTAFFDREFVGKVQTMDRNVTAKPFGNVVKVIAVIDNPKGELKTGMTGYAKIGGTHDAGLEGVLAGAAALLQRPGLVLDPLIGARRLLRIAAARARCRRARRRR